MQKARGESFDAFSFRSRDGPEADMILDSGSQREVMEIELTSEATPEDLSRLDKVATVIGGTLRVLACRGGDRSLPGIVG